jgi:ABC-type multidrug transport system ATPase subunit
MRKSVPQLILQDFSVPLGNGRWTKPISVATDNSILVITGENGSGKSTLLRAVHRVMLGESVNHRGTLTIGDVSAGKVSSRKTILVPRGAYPVIYPDLKAVEKVKIIAAATPRRRTAIEALAQLKVSDELWRRPAAALSGGERTVVAIAAALAARPQVILLDEPLLGLDVDAAENLIEVLSLLATSGQQRLLVTDQSTERFGGTAAVAVL